MIVALLFMITATAVTGMANLAADRGEGPFATVIARSIGRLVFRDSDVPLS
jgi:hypothetical protein